MAITNDVALITFVPLGILVLKMADQQALICITVILQTLAANLGSMLTPMGNPQNLYLYTRSQLTPGGFLMVTLPCTLIAGILLLVSIFWAGRKKTPLAALQLTKTTLQPGKLTCYLVLFVCCLLAVFRILPVEWLLGIVLIYLLIRDRTLLKKVDYSLLLTFVAFFIFVGNMGRFPVFHDFMAQVVQGHERITAIAASQCISNVPAALLLSGFTQQWKELIIGTNIGGLGTLIASMASLISYKQIAQQFPEKKGRYLLRFTLWNLLFLGIFLLLNPVL